MRSWIYRKDKVMSNYGIPYQGSKAKIAEKICKIFPKADNFYDLFGGGFSITHCMLEKRRKDYKAFHFNEIRNGMCDLVKDAISGKYNYNVFKPEFIDREKFFKEKETNAYIKMVWSFGNNGRTYLFGKDIEPYKRSMHNAIVFNQFDNTAKEVFGIDKFKDGYTITQRRLFLRNKIALIHKGKSDGEIRKFQCLEQLERLQHLQQLERLQHLEFYNVDYRQVPILDNSIIYCDIPYKNTGGYDKNKNFNHADFFDWAHAQKNPVYISEYDIKDPRFKLIALVNKRSFMSGEGTGKLMQEKIYINKAGLARSQTNQ